eukprot:188164_1
MKAIRRSSDAMIQSLKEIDNCWLFGNALLNLPNIVLPIEVVQIGLNRMYGCWDNGYKKDVAVVLEGVRKFTVESTGINNWLAHGLLPMVVRIFVGEADG